MSELIKQFILTMMKPPKHVNDLLAFVEENYKQGKITLIEYGRLLALCSHILKCRMEIPMKKIISFNIENYNRKQKYPTIVDVYVDKEIVKNFPSKIIINDQEYKIDYNKMQVVIYMN